jgi:excisionase family DNA binding protein
MMYVKLGKSMDKRLSIGEAAKYLGISRDTLRRWEKKGKVSPVRSPSNRRYYSKEQLDSLLSNPQTRTEVKKPEAKPATKQSLNLVVYSLLALVAAVIIAFLIQTFFL